MSDNIVNLDRIDPNTPEETIAARYFTCANATDKDDAILLLDMLGLIKPVHKQVTQDEYRRAQIRARNKRRRSKSTDEREV